MVGGGALHLVQEGGLGTCTTDLWYDYFDTDVNRTCMMTCVAMTISSFVSVCASVEVGRIVSHDLHNPPPPPHTHTGYTHIPGSNVPV